MLHFSLIQAKYVTMSECVAQLLWMICILEDYGFITKIDNVSTINLTKNPMHHSRIKRINMMLMKCKSNPYHMIFSEVMFLFNVFCPRIMH